MSMDTKVTVVCTMNCTKVMENELQMLTISIHTIPTDWSTENLQFHRVSYLGDMLFLIHNQLSIHS